MCRPDNRAILHRRLYFVRGHSGLRRIPGSEGSASPQTVSHHTRPPRCSHSANHQVDVLISLTNLISCTQMSITKLSELKGGVPLGKRGKDENLKVIGEKYGRN